MRYAAAARCPSVSTVDSAGSIAPHEPYPEMRHGRGGITTADDAVPTRAHRRWTRDATPAPPDWWAHSAPAQIGRRQRPSMAEFCIRRSWRTVLNVVPPIGASGFAMLVGLSHHEDPWESAPQGNIVRPTPIRSPG